MVYVVALGVTSTLLFLVNPAYLMFAMFSLFFIVTLARAVNFYKIVFMLKRYARDTAKLRSDIHARLHTGFKDYNVAVEDDHKTRGKTAGYIR
jgi:hypothetical protein